MSRYATRQRTRLLDFLITNADTALSAKQIALALETENISLSSVYRYLAELESEGKVRKLTRAGQREVYYQYSDHEYCRKLIHLTCTECGRTTHLDERQARELISAAMEICGFSVDAPKSIIYGMCRHCRKITNTESGK